jgi:diacylglycerol kinase family enzyme
MVESNVAKMSLASAASARMHSSEQPKTVLVVHNPRAGPRSRRSIIHDLTTRIARDAWDVNLLDDLEQLRLAATRLGEQGQLRAIVAAGGDGTVAALANRTPIGTPLIVYPLGTENLIAKYLGYQQRTDFVAGLLESGREIAIDAGQAGDKLFVLMISAGFDAEVVRRVAEGRAGHIRRWTYAKPLWATLRSYGYPALRLQWENCEASSPSGGVQGQCAVVRWVFGMNLSKYAFGFNFTPRAVGNDGLLDVCTFSEGSFFHTFRYAWGLFSRRHLKFRDTQIDFGGYLPVEVCMLPGRLRFIVEPMAADRLTALTHA